MAAAIAPALTTISVAFWLIVVCHHCSLPPLLPSCQRNVATRLHIPAGFLRIPVFSVPVSFFFTEIMIPVPP
jgi:hypothetical protein